MNSNIINLLKERKIEEANKILGYNYFIEGEVEKGKQNGQKIGFRTLNLKNEGNYLYSGVYMTKTYINGKCYKSMTNIGTHPTISELPMPIIETHVFNFNEDIYGSKVKVIFYKLLRNEKKFNSLNELMQQLEKDKISIQNENY